MLWFHCLRDGSCSYRGGEDIQMNKRQWKKKYKKEHGCNPPSSKHVHKLEDSLSVIINRLCQIVGDMFRAIKNGIDTIRSMPEDEFIEMVGKLTPEQQELAWKIRKEG